MRVNKKNEGGERETDQIVQNKTICMQSVMPTWKQEANHHLHYFYVFVAPHPDQCVLGVNKIGLKKKNV